LVFSKATRGAKVKIAGVFVSKSNIFDFSSLPPIGGTFIVFCAKVGFGQETETALKRQEKPSFLKPIQEGNDGSTVDKVERRKLTVSSPRPGRTADALELKAEPPNRGEVGMGRTDTEPVVGDNWGKGRMEKPGVFKAENRATRSFGGNREV
jgi:hypothetical protein